MSINPLHKKLLFKYIWELLKQDKVWTYRMNGIENHIHMLIDLPPTLALADLIKKIKQTTSIWMKTKEQFRGFQGWGKGYFAVSVSPSEKEAVIEYISNQEIHHRRIPFINEIESLVVSNDMIWYDDDWE